MTTPGIAAAIRRYFAAYEAKNRAIAEAMLTADFRFSSPLDDYIDRATYFQRCWPNSDSIKAFRIEKLFVEGTEAFVMYYCEPTNRPPFRNTEFFRFEGDQISEVQVYFGASIKTGPVQR